MFMLFYFVFLLSPCTCRHNVPVTDFVSLIGPVNLKLLPQHSEIIARSSVLMKIINFNKLPLLHSIFVKIVSEAK